ncbi:E3 SUMO-protein ligase RanBP2 [Eurosta solidaginis]|uniref:E3 SUMO-protein ligase RanBP2 n=1 Tax=Eurosta solidaginis TaxID=178769 RepID=UPI003530E4FE
MYKTKKEVDAHVRTALCKLRSEEERNLRSFTIAKLYFKINEYSSAEQYICSYLSVKEDNDQAHKLLGQCYQRLKKLDKALQAFQRSLQLNPKQPDILADVCQLLLDHKNVNLNKARYWCDLAESEKVQHDAVFSLRLKLLNKENLEANQVEDLIQREISMRPNDVQLRVRLIRNYIEQNKVIDAFKYIYNFEMSMLDDFVNNNEWYNTIWLVLNKYEQIPNTNKDWEFWLLLIICLERQVNISFTLTSGSGIAGVTETANLLFNLDQYLFKATQMSDKLCAQQELINLFLDHYRGQMTIHAVALIFKRELLQNKNKWKETVKIILPLLLLAYQTNVPSNREPWMKHCDEQSKHLIQLWNREGSFRCAQAGRTLLACVADDLATSKENVNQQINHILGNSSPLWRNDDELLSQIRQTCSDKQWRRNVFALLYCNSDQKVKEQSSLLIKSPKLNEPVFELPSFAYIEHHEEIAQYLKPQSLQHMVYLSLGNDNLAYVRAKYFSGLNFSTQNLAFCGAESLNQLDVDTFLYAATIQAKQALQVEREALGNYNYGNRSACGRPRILPFVNLHEKLCTEEQSNWWLAAYQVYKNLSNENLAELRANLQFGIEAVRGVNGPKIDMIIVFKLGQIFVARSQDIVKNIEKAFLESRAENIYKYGLNMVKMNNKGVLEPFRKLFKFPKANTSIIEHEISNAAEDAVSYLASRYFKKADYEGLIDELAGIQLPFATYLQAEAYRKLDEANKTPKKAKRTYLDRASECLNQTLNLLKSTESTNPDHPLNSIIHTELKRLQQATMKFINEGSPVVGHNNSSTYEDAEDDFYNEISLPATPAINRTRRETVIGSPRNNEMESLLKQMVNTLSLVKEELTSLKDKISGLEESMKRTCITSNPPSRDDASHVLDDLYMIEDTLQNPLYHPPAQPHMTVSLLSNVPNGSNSPALAGVHSPFAVTQQSQQQQQQTAQQRNSMHMQPNHIVAAAAAAAYNNSIFNPNYPMNFYTQPYIMPQPQVPPVSAGSMLGPRSALPMQYMDASLTFSMAPSTPLLPAPPQGGRPNNFYGLLTQPHQQPTVPAQLPQLSVPMSIAPIIPPIACNAPNLQGVSSLVQAISSQPASGGMSSAIQFNKSLNNQPVEKGPPANVVITNSDPLPNPNRPALMAQQPTLSVTIPPHHIKPSFVATSEINMQPSIPQMSLQTSSTTSVTVSNAIGITGFGLGSTTPVASTATIFGGSSVKSITSNPPSTTISTTTFSFKPQIEQAQAAAAAGNISGESITILNKLSESFSSSGNKSGAEPEVEYDPRPDFKPIIPLPDEIEVRTGEEDEDIKFCCRAKLYRYSDKDWKERGIGDIKILRNKEGFSRILMRREKTYKICANHKIIKELILTTPISEKKGHIWIANDFADEELKTERFLVRFKTTELAEKFRDAFIKAQKEAEELDIKKDGNGFKKNLVKEKESSQQLQSENIGMSNFATSTPAAKLVSDKVAPVVPSSTTLVSTEANAFLNGGVSKSLFSGIATTFTTATDPTTSTTAVNNNEGDLLKSTMAPFANFSLGKSPAATISISSTAAISSTTTSASPFGNIFSSLGKPGCTDSSPFNIESLPTFQSSLAIEPVNMAVTTSLNKSGASDTEEEYVPTATFNPVIPLPDLVEVSTGEENEILLYEHRAKLLRFDKEAGEWKERGIGNMKLLQDKEDLNRVRLVMRREQIHKLCCNQRLYKNTVFKYAKNSTTALTWAGQDFSENELATEMLTVRFKLPETCKQFHETVLKAQANMRDVADEENVNANIAEQIKENAIESKESTSKGFGDTFKPKAGSWDCSACYTRNAADKKKCVACETSKNGIVPTKKDINILPKSLPKPSFVFGLAPTTTYEKNIPKFSTKDSFNYDKPTLTSSGIDSEKTNMSALPPTAKIGFGDQFKPKIGSWTCQGCYLLNVIDDAYCKACNTPKDDTISKKESPNHLLALSNPKQKFSFGFNAVTETYTSTATTVCVDNSNNTLPNSGFVFGGPTTTAPNESGKSIFGNFATSEKTLPLSQDLSGIKPTENPSLLKPSFSFSLSSKAMETMTASSGAGGESTFSLDKIDFNFTLKPKSPGKSGKTPIKFGCGGGDADVVTDDVDENEYQEEENNTYFTPVIPLPEKIEVKTGEENEEVLYVHRAKLYRYMDGEWKERGIGDVKILRHKETNKLRIVMRRDQVLKICLNHVLNKEVEYKYKDDKSWLFIVYDFSEDSVKLEKFSLRFKTKEIAQGFMDAVNSAVAGIAIEGTSNSVTSTTSNLTKDLEKENIFTKSTTPNILDADRATAEKLQLPYEFFITKPTCVGCRGCDSDKFVFSSSDKATTFVDNEDCINVLKPLELPSLSLPKSDSTNRPLLKQSALSPMILLPAAERLEPSKSNNIVTPKTTETNIFSGSGGVSTTAFSAAADNTASDFSFAAAMSNNNEKKTGSSSGGFLFGNSIVGRSGSIFSEDNKPVFGETPSIFGNSNTMLSKSTNCTRSETDKSRLIFGNTNNSMGVQFGAKTVFGTVDKPIFDGKSTPTTTSIFSSASNSTSNAQEGTSFGGSSFTTLANTESSIFGCNNTTTMNFRTGNCSNNSIFQEQSTVAPSFADLSIKAGIIDFASLAAKARSESTSKSDDKPGSGGFVGLTDQDAFSSFAKSNVNISKVSKENDKAAGDDENYDPHYDPIIALPDEIQVSTGEEEETKLFGERSTLFRYDSVTKEWKERGVGELKILQHKTKQTYRMVMRREQIHKLVLNHAIGSDFSFNNMNNNPKSFIWATMNYAESSEGELEKLAVRFKNVDVANCFREKLNQCIEATQHRAE